MRGGFADVILDLRNSKKQEEVSSKDQQELEKSFATGKLGHFVTLISTAQRTIYAQLKELENLL